MLLTANVDRTSPTVIILDAVKLDALKILPYTVE